MPITNGTFKYEQKIKTGDYEHKLSMAELAFTLPDGEDIRHKLDYVRGVAQHHVHATLNAPPVTVSNISVEPKAPANKAPAKGAAKAAEKAAEKTVVDASVIEDDKPAFLKDKHLNPTTGKLVSEEVAAENAKAAAEVVDDGLGDILGEAPKEITDKELTDATQRCQAANKNSPAIRKALKDVGVVSPPGRLIDIAQDKRQKYLDILKEVKPLA